MADEDEDSIYVSLAKVELKKMFNGRTQPNFTFSLIFRPLQIFLFTPVRRLEMTAEISPNSVGGKPA
ncbi:hypothetical protein CCACVL1_10228 [Corchorus capsularis]|uniref:Uncharacterized protein n=1 Tax=Corchorus capsularis TaxID=210143 RepID=A0A1R3IS18_COCAP|nr:hypothetical protein CCACVL1_10228 [Corchorus capsularis]